jgi:hypothetical protein
MSKKEIHIIIKDAEPENSEKLNDLMEKILDVFAENDVDPAAASYCLCELLCALTVDAEINKEEFLKTIDCHYEAVLKHFKETK